MGADYFQEPDWTLVSQPKKYIEKFKETYVRLFNTEPPQCLKTLLEKNDHPELDTSEFLEGHEVNQLTEVCNLQGLYRLKDELMIAYSVESRLVDQLVTQQQRWVLSKYSGNYSIKQNLIE